MPKEKAKSEFEKLQKKLKEYEVLKSEYLAGWQRAKADFLNYKKEEMERIGEIMKYANEELILKILPILDNFLIAEKKISENLKNDKNISGLLQINQQLKDFLKTQGIEEIKAVGEKFNPNFHDVVEEMETELSRGQSSGESTEVEKRETGIIIEEIQKGYTLYGRVIRPAKVRVTK